MRSTPLPTAIWLVATLALTAASLGAFLSGLPVPVHVHLLLFTALFVTRVAGQVGVAVLRPGWLPPMHEWNFVPYRVLLPAQVSILALMVALVAGSAEPGPAAARGLVGSAFVYWAAMGARYAIRMARLSAERWFGGAVPIVFHCVLAAFLFVYGASYAD